MSAKQIPCFMDENQNVIQFFPTTREGFTHQIVLNGLAVDWYNARAYSARSYVLKAHAESLLAVHAKGIKGRGFK